MLIIFIDEVVVAAEIAGCADYLKRLLDLDAAADYLSISPWTIHDMEAAGTLKRVRIPQANGKEFRRLLFDRLELDQLINSSKE